MKKKTFPFIFLIKRFERSSLIKDIYGNVFLSIGPFIYYKTQAKMCYK